MSQLEPSPIKLIYCPQNNRGSLILENAQSRALIYFCPDSKTLCRHNVNYMLLNFHYESLIPIFNTLKSLGFTIDCIPINLRVKGKSRTLKMSYRHKMKGINTVLSPGMSYEEIEAIYNASKLSTMLSS